MSISQWLRQLACLRFLAFKLAQQNEVLFPNENKTLFLDSFALAEIAADRAFMDNVRDFISSNDYTLILGVTNLLEIYRWQKRWPEMISLVSSDHFCIVENSERIPDEEVRNYPNDIVRPISF